MGLHGVAIAAIQTTQVRHLEARAASVEAFSSEERDVGCNVPTVGLRKMLDVVCFVWSQHEGRDRHWQSARRNNLLYCFYINILTSYLPIFINRDANQDQENNWNLAKTVDTAQERWSGSTGWFMWFNWC